LAEHPEARQLWDERERAAGRKNAPLYRRLADSRSDRRVRDLVAKSAANIDINSACGLITLHADRIARRKNSQVAHSLY